MRAAVEVLAGMPGISGLRMSTLRETAPWGEGCRDQPAYLNGAVVFTTTLKPDVLLRVLLEIEDRFGRRRKGRWSPRSLDLDLLLYGDHVIKTSSLVVPHPHLAERRFVLEPLAELSPDLIVPQGDTVISLLSKL